MRTALFLVAALAAPSAAQTRGLVPITHDLETGTTTLAELPADGSTSWPGSSTLDDVPPLGYAGLGHFGP